MSAIISDSNLNPLYLTILQYRLFRLLLEHPYGCLKNMIMAEVWNGIIVKEHMISFYVGKINRLFMIQYGVQPIECLYFVGYRISPDLLLYFVRSGWVKCKNLLSLKSVKSF